MVIAKHVLSRLTRPGRPAAPSPDFERGRAGRVAMPARRCRTRACVQVPRNIDSRGASIHTVGAWYVGKVAGSAKPSTSRREVTRARRCSAVGTSTRSTRRGERASPRDTATCSSAAASGASSSRAPSTRASSPTRCRSGRRSRSASRKLPQFDRAVQKLKRIYVSGAVECEIDDSGRILVPPDAPRPRAPDEGRPLGGRRQLRRALGQGRVGSALRDHRRRAAGHRGPPRGARAMSNRSSPCLACSRPTRRSSGSGRGEFDEVTDVKRFVHATVMRDEVVRALAPRGGGVYVDATLGGGGHTVAILEAEPQGARSSPSTGIAVAIAAAARAPRPGRRPRDPRARRTSRAMREQLDAPRRRRASTASARTSA